MKKAIKSTFVKGLSLLLVLVMVISVPISALAATDTVTAEVTEAAEEDYGIALATSSAKDAMIDTDIFRALLYLGYDSDGYLRNTYEDGKALIFEPRYIASGLKNRHESSLKAGNTATIYTKEPRITEKIIRVLRSISSTNAK